MCGIYLYAKINVCNNINNNFNSLFDLFHQATAKYWPTHTGYDELVG